jgi:Ca2+-binding EF-hand superfamily protein
LKKAFDKYDKRQTGVIRAFNIPDVMRSAGQNPSLDEAQKMIAEAGYITGCLLSPNF